MNMEYLAVAFLSCIMAGCSVQNTKAIEGEMPFVQGTPTKELLKEMIDEEIDQKNFGGDIETRGELSRDLRNRAKDTANNTDVDNKERGIISRIESKLTKIAGYDSINLYSNELTPLLRKLDRMLDKIAAEQSMPGKDRP